MIFRINAVRQEMFASLMSYDLKYLKTNLLCAKCFYILFVWVFFSEILYPDNKIKLSYYCSAFLWWDIVFRDLQWRQQKGNLNWTVRRNLHNIRRYIAFFINLIKKYDSTNERWSLWILIVLYLDASADRKM